ncbi:2-C-methyl-D-erythritol 2,4-cyclodiphosphate synthase [Shigella flexneri]
MKAQLSLVAYAFLRKRIAAHSDGDVVLDALTDALLARRRWAYGKLFPDTDRHRRCRQPELLREAWRRIRRRVIPWER